MALLTTERLEGRDLLLTERVRAGIALPDGVEVVVMVGAVISARRGDRLVVTVGDNRIAVPEDLSAGDAALCQIRITNVWAQPGDDDDAVAKATARLAVYLAGEPGAAAQPLRYD